MRRGIACPARERSEGRAGKPYDRQARPLAAETVQPLRQGAGTGPDDRTGAAPCRLRFAVETAVRPGPDICGG